MQKKKAIQLAGAGTALICLLVGTSIVLHGHLHLREIDKTREKAVAGEAREGQQICQRYAHSLVTGTGDNRTSFTLDYPDSWALKQVKAEADMEWDVLENERGVTINYYAAEGGFGSQYYGGNYTFSYAEAVKAADSAFHPVWLPLENYSSAGDFAVAKVKTYAQKDGFNGAGKQKVDGQTVYAVIPESYLGEIEYKGSGFWAALSFEYLQPTVVLAVSPDGTFTPQEEEEIVKILSTFREKPQEA